MARFWFVHICSYRSYSPKKFSVFNNYIENFRSLSTTLSLFLSVSVCIFQFHKSTVQSHNYVWTGATWFGDIEKESWFLQFNLVICLRLTVTIKIVQHPNTIFTHRAVSIEPGEYLSRHRQCVWLLLFRFEIFFFLLLFSFFFFVFFLTLHFNEI